MNLNETISNEGSLRPAAPPRKLAPRLPPPDEEMLSNIPAELRQAWVDYMSRGFENNQVMFKRTLEAFMKPYQITVGMYVMIFLVGILFFAVAAYLGLTGNQPAVAISFGGLSVISFVLFFIRQPVQALEENLEFISWLGVAFNTYWTRLMYISNKETVQQDLKAATDDFSILIERIIDKRTKLRAKRPGVNLVEKVRGETRPATDIVGTADQEEKLPSVQPETRPR
jgi:ABC-type multidrug transport system fused ATPase/permease subunit